MSVSLFLAIAAAAGVFAAFNPSYPGELRLLLGLKACLIIVAIGWLGADEE